MYSITNQNHTTMKKQNFTDAEQALLLEVATLKKKNLKAIDQATKKPVGTTAHEVYLQFAAQHKGEFLGILSALKILGNKALHLEALKQWSTIK